MERIGCIKKGEAKIHSKTNKQTNKKQRKEEEEDAKMHWEWSGR